APELAVGRTQQFTATGLFSDMTSRPLAAAVWSSSNTGVAVASNDSGNRGQATGIAPGTSTITATAGAISGSTTVTVFTPLQVAAVSPVDGASAVPRSASVFVTFNKAINAATLTTNTADTTC